MERGEGETEEGEKTVKGVSEEFGVARGEGVGEKREEGVQHLKLLC